MATYYETKPSAAEVGKRAISRGLSNYTQLLLDKNFKAMVSAYTPVPKAVMETPEVSAGSGLTEMTEHGTPMYSTGHAFTGDEGAEGWELAKAMSDAEVKAAMVVRPTWAVGRTGPIGEVPKLTQAAMERAENPLTKTQIENMIEGHREGDRLAEAARSAVATRQSITNLPLGELPPTLTPQQVTGWGKGMRQAAEIEGSLAATEASRTTDFGTLPQVPTTAERALRELYSEGGKPPSAKQLADAESFGKGGRDVYQMSAAEQREAIEHMTDEEARRFSEQKAARDTAAIDRELSLEKAHRSYGPRDRRKGYESMKLAYELRKLNEPESLFKLKKKLSR